MIGLDVPLPRSGMGEDAAIAWVRERMERDGVRLGAADALAHMDPPPPKVASALAGACAAVNANLLHPDLSPFAGRAEAAVMGWLLPEFGMAAGHMCSGSSVANLTAIWCAREHRASRVVASEDAHVSVAKAAHILGMAFETVAVDARGKLRADALPALGDACLVATAGTTGRGAVDPLERYGAKWLHVDAAWGGPLRFTQYAERLNGIEAADSVAVSAHKWLYQPKGSAVVMFKTDSAQDKVSFCGSYLAVPNVGVEGSRGAAAVPLLGTLLAWGREGLAERIEADMARAETLADRLKAHSGVDLLGMPETGVVVWRPTVANAERVLAELGRTASRTMVDDEVVVRHVPANPHADIEAVWAKIERSLEGGP